MPNPVDNFCPNIIRQKKRGETIVHQKKGKRVKGLRQKNDNLIVKTKLERRSSKHDARADTNKNNGLLSQPLNQSRFDFISKPQTLNAYRTQITRCIISESKSFLLFSIILRGDSEAHRLMGRPTTETQKLAALGLGFTPGRSRSKS